VIAPQRLPHTSERHSDHEVESRSGRLLELEILPQLLNSADAVVEPPGTDVDWGNIAVFTCPQNCKRGSPGKLGGVYTEEYAWRQPGADRHLLVRAPSTSFPHPFSFFLLHPSIHSLIHLPTRKKSLRSACFASQDDAVYGK